MEDKIKIMLLTGFVTKEHVFRTTNDMLITLLESTGRYDVKVCEAYEGVSKEQLSHFDGILCHYDGKNFPTDIGQRMGETTENNVMDFVAGGRGIAFYHSSAWVDDAWPDRWKDMLGGTLSIEYGSRRSPKNDREVDSVRDQYGITKYMPDKWMVVEDDIFAGIRWREGNKVEPIATVYDEVDYYRVPNFPPPHHPVDIPDGKLENMDQVNTDVPVAWVNHFGEGRVFVTTIGHNDGTIKRHAFMNMLIRGLEWAATGEATIEPPDRAGERRLRPWPFY
jgi:type 1 glutamine amidotransferase